MTDAPDPPRSSPSSLTLVGLASPCGCGVPLDSEPREITDRDVRQLVAPTTTTTQPATATGTRRERGLLLRPRRTPRRGRRQVDADPTIAKAVDLLLEGPSEDQRDRGLTDVAPPGHRAARRARSAAASATLNLSSDMSNIGSTAEKEAYAQLAYTVLGTDDVNQVRFEIDGKRVAPPTDEGNVDDRRPPTPTTRP